MTIRPGSLGSRTIVCRHMPPAPGCHDDPDPWPRRPASSCQLRPPSVERNSAASSTPAYTVSGSVREGSRCQTRRLPGVRGPVVPLVRPRHPLVLELVAMAARSPRRRPSAESAARPPARLGGVDPLRFDRDPFRWYISQPAKWGPCDVPVLALGVGAQAKAPLRVPTEHSYTGHLRPPSLSQRTFADPGREPAGHSCHQSVCADGPNPPISSDRVGNRSRLLRPR